MLNFRLVAERINKHERKGRAEIIMYMQNQETPEFWKTMNGAPKDFLITVSNCFPLSYEYPCARVSVMVSVFLPNFLLAKMATISIRIKFKTQLRELVKPLGIRATTIILQKKVIGKYGPPMIYHW